jgi:hypothetical protein
LILNVIRATVVVSIMVRNNVVPVLVPEVTAVMVNYVMMSVVMDYVIVTVMVLSECWYHGQKTCASSNAGQFLPERNHGSVSVLESRGLGNRLDTELSGDRSLQQIILRTLKREPE